MKRICEDLWLFVVAVVTVFFCALFMLFIFVGIPVGIICGITWGVLVILKSFGIV